MPAEEIPRQGTLYLRDNHSAQRLCFPIRNFRVLWFERGEAVSFLNLLMESRVAYGTAKSPGDGDSSIPAGLDHASWGLLAEHIRDYRLRTQTEPLPPNTVQKEPPAGVEADTWNAFLAYAAHQRAARKRPSPRTVAVPRAGEAPIVPWEELRAGRSEDALLWVEGGVVARKPGKVADEHSRWRSMLPAFAAMEQVNKTPFFFVHAPVSIANEKATRSHEIGAGGGLYSHGFVTKPAATYRLRVDEVTPHAFSDDAPATPPFKLTIGKSDSAIRPAVKEIQIDGPYGHYEFSFDLDPARVGTYALLRLSTDGLKLPVSEEAEAGTLEMPDLVVPLVIRQRWLRNFSWGLAAFAFIVSFVSAAQWMPRCGIDPKSAAGALIQALIFGFALFFANRAGLGDLASNVGKKV
jgi:hypothetical protein